MVLSLLYKLLSLWSCKYLHGTDTRIDAPRALGYSRSPRARRELPFRARDRILASSGRSSSRQMTSTVSSVSPNITEHNVAHAHDIL